MKKVYISLGSDCSVSYQLRKLGLQTMGTLPFDWMKITNINTLIDILDNNFNDIVKYDCYLVKQQNPIFDYFDDANQTLKSLRKMKHNIYSIELPHEHEGVEIDIMEFEKKYSRRIERFNMIVKDVSIKKIFIRLGNQKEKNKISILEDVLSRYGCNNFQLQFINIDEYNSLLTKEDSFNWHRDYIPWMQILSYSFQN